MQLRKRLDLHVNLVHGFSIPGLKLRHDNLDIVVIRCVQGSGSRGAVQCGGGSVQGGGRWCAGSAVQRSASGATYGGAVHHCRVLGSRAGLKAGECGFYGVRR